MVSPDVYFIYSNVYLLIEIRNLSLSQVVMVVKNLSASAGDVKDAASVPGSGRSPEGGHG